MSLRPVLTALTALVLMLAACAQPSVPSDAPASRQATNGSTSADASTPKPSAAAASQDYAPPKSTPLPPEVERTPAKAPALRTACHTDADCTVKNVGSCCGAMPACVSKDSPVDPEAVKADCARQGMSSTCGFKSIQSCSCVAGTCQDAGGAATPVDR